MEFNNSASILARLLSLWLPSRSDLVTPCSFLSARSCRWMSSLSSRAWRRQAPMAWMPWSWPREIPSSLMLITSSSQTAAGSADGLPSPTAPGATATSMLRLRKHTHRNKKRLKYSALNCNNNNDDNKIIITECHHGVGLQVEGPKKDLHSGGYGGVVIEPMTDLIGILGECILKHTSNHSVAQEGKTL